MTVMTRKELWDKQSTDSPAKAEESQVEAQQSGHHMSDERTGLAGVEVEPKPHSHQQGEQLTRHKVNLHRGTYKNNVIDVWDPDDSKKRLIAEAGHRPGSGIRELLRETSK